jgi:hypothetical protein
LLLLPLGGYRVYRPEIIRSDTLMPVTLGLMLVFGVSTFFLVKNISSKFRMIYTIGTVALLALYTLVDFHIYKDNACEREALKKISQSTENNIVLDCNCAILSWTKTTDPRNADLNSQLLLMWGITKHKIDYEQK